MLAAECVLELAVLRTQRSTNLTAECAWTLPEDTITHIDPCGCSICRECIRSLIVSQIESHRFLIMCHDLWRNGTENGTEETGSKSDRRGHAFVIFH